MVTPVALTEFVISRIGSIIKRTSANAMNNFLFFGFKGDKTVAIVPNLANTFLFVFTSLFPRLINIVSACAALSFSTVKEVIHERLFCLQLVEYVETNRLWFSTILSRFAMIFDKDQGENQITGLKAGLRKNGKQRGFLSIFAF